MNGPQKKSSAHHENLHAVNTVRCHTSPQVAVGTGTSCRTSVCVAGLRQLNGVQVKMFRERMNSDGGAQILHSEGSLCRSAALHNPRLPSSTGFKALLAAAQTVICVSVSNALWPQRVMDHKMIPSPSVGDVRGPCDAESPQTLHLCPTLPGRCASSQPCPNSPTFGSILLFKVS